MSTERKLASLRHSEDVVNIANDDKTIADTQPWQGDTDPSVHLHNLPSHPHQHHLVLPEQETEQRKLPSLLVMSPCPNLKLRPIYMINEKYYKEISLCKPKMPSQIHRNSST